MLKGRGLGRGVMGSDDDDGVCDGFVAMFDY
jgi:hypothetical protein